MTTCLFVIFCGGSTEKDPSDQRVWLYSNIGGKAMPSIYKSIVYIAVELHKRIY
jgi:hypothetical protein